MPPTVPDKVVVHPIVLLSVVDHFNRIQKITSQERVVGVLLGSWHKKTVDVATSFAGKFQIYTISVIVIDLLLHLST